MVIWIIGLSGAGKTTIGSEVYRQWSAVDPATVFLDGDDVRRMFGQDRPGSYTVDERRRNAQRIGEICGWLDRQGINVVCSILSIFEDLRLQNRQAFSEYFEVYLRAPIDVLAERDIKDLYYPALKGRKSQVVGVDIEFPEPKSADLIIDNGNPVVNVPQTAKQILQVSGVLK